MFEVVVGNIGVVHRGPDRAEAFRVFAHYVEQSKAGIGRGASEAVVIFQDDDLFHSYTPKENNANGTV